EPEAPSQPPPRALSNHQSGAGAAGSARSGTYDTSVASRGSPTRPSAIARATSARSVAHRNSWPTNPVTPARAAAEAISRASAASSPDGFAPPTRLPAPTPPSTRRGRGGGGGA